MALTVSVCTQRELPLYMDDPLRALGQGWHAYAAGSPDVSGLPATSPEFAHKENLARLLGYFVDVASVILDQWSDESDQFVNVYNEIRASLEMDYAYRFQWVTMTGSVVGQISQYGSLLMLVWYERAESVGPYSAPADDPATFTEYSMDDEAFEFHSGYNPVKQPQYFLLNILSIFSGLYLGANVDWRQVQTTVYESSDYAQKGFQKYSGMGLDLIVEGAVYAHKNVPSLQSVGLVLASVSVSLAVILKLLSRWRGFRTEAPTKVVVDVEKEDFKDVVMRQLDYGNDMSSKGNEMLSKIWNAIVAEQKPVRDDAHITQEMAMAGSVEVGTNHLIEKNVGLLYGRTKEGVQVFVGLAGRVGNDVVTCLHNFTHFEELELVPASRTNRRYKQILRRGDGNIVEVTEPGVLISWEPPPLDMIIFKVECTWALLAAVPVSVPYEHCSLKSVVYEEATDSIKIYSGKIDSVYKSLVSHKSTTLPGSSGSLLYFIKDTKIYAGAIHVGANNRSGFNYGHLLTCLTVESESNKWGASLEDRMRYRFAKAKSFDWALKRSRKNVVDTSAQHLAIVNRVKTRPADDDPAWNDMNFDEMDENDWTAEKTGVEACDDKTIIAELSHQRPFQMLETLKVEDPAHEYLKYLNGQEFVKAAKGDKYGAFEVQEVGTLSSYRGSRSKLTEPKPIPVIASIEAVVPYAGKFMMPPKDGDAQRASLIAHASLKKSLSKPLSINRLRKAAERLISELRPYVGEVKVHPLITRAIAGEKFELNKDEAREVLSNIRFKLDASAGVGLEIMGYKTKEDVLENVPEILVNAALGRIRRLALGHLDRDCTKIFIKDEPHTMKKIEEKRYRIISSISMVDELVERLFMTDLHKNLIANHMSTPLGVGLGNMPEEVGPLMAYLKGDALPLSSNDLKAYDWHQEGQWLTTEARVKGCLITGQPLGKLDTHMNPIDPTVVGVAAKTMDITTDPAEVLYRLTLAGISSPFVDAKGRVYGKGYPGIQNSGRFNTSIGNSSADAMQEYYVDPSIVKTKKAGDDGVSSGSKMSKEDLEKGWADIGHVLTDYQVSDLSKGKLSVEFCSHHWTMDAEGKTSIKPVSAAKSVAKFVVTAPQMNVNVAALAASDVGEHAQNASLTKALVSWVLNKMPKEEVDLDEDRDVEDDFQLQTASNVKQLKVMPPKQKSKQNKPQQKLNKPKKQNAAKQTTAPTSYGTSFKSTGYSVASVGTGHIRVRGHELLGPVVTDGLDANIAAIIDINPACWRNSRLALLAQTYEKYRINRVLVSYVPSVGTTTPGVVALAVETDADERLPSGVDALQRMLNTYSSTVGPAWQPNKLVFTRNTQDSKWYSASMLGHSQRSDVTQFLVYALAEGVSQTVVTAGRLVVDYDIEFLYPELEFTDGGAQFVPMGNLINAPTTAGGPLLVDTANNPGLFFGRKIIEWRPTIPNIVSDLVMNNDPVEIIRGGTYFIAWAAGVWSVYMSYEAAKAGVSPIRTSTARPSNFYTFLGFARALVSISNAR